MVTVNSSVRINRPVAEIFEFLSDARNEPKWIPGAKNVELLSASPVQKGSRFRGEYARAGVVEVELIEFARPSRVTFRAQAKMLDFDDEVRLSASPEGTLLEATMRAEPKGFLKLMSFLLKSGMQKQFDANWAILKDYLEKKSAKK